MTTLEAPLVQLLTALVGADALNALTNDPQAVAILAGALVAFSAALPGAFLMLAAQSMTTDAISHSVLLGIVLAFLLLTFVGSQEPELNSPLLLAGAALAGVVTVLLTSAIQRSGLVRADAALGLVFPLLFGIAILFIARFTADVHLDSDAVILGEIGVAWADANSHCFAHCQPLSITPDNPLAEFGRRCVNCAAQGIGPRDAAAIFEQVCVNCGEYSAARAWSARLVDTEPLLVFWPRALSALLVTALFNGAFVALFYKELKLATFDAALARALGFRPALLQTALMLLVSVTAVAAFDAVGSVLVVAFFIIPPTTAWLLSERLARLLLLAPALGALSAALGYELARGFPGLLGEGAWNTSISAAMVLAMFALFLLAWVFSPRQGLLAALLRRRGEQRRFAEQLLLGHIRHHQGTERAAGELAPATLHEHLNWPTEQTQCVLQRAQRARLVQLHNGTLQLTRRGEKRAEAFR